VGWEIGLICARPTNQTLRLEPSDVEHGARHD
jgi:hypothetical protein